MRRILLFILISFSTFAFAGQCDVYRVSVFPSGENIKQNNVFLITYREVQYRFKSHLNNVVFEAVNQNNVITKMKIADTMFGENYGQILLKPTKKFPLNDTVIIRMRWIDSTKKMSNSQYFPTVIGRYSVTGKNDKTPPRWLDDSVTTSTDFRNMQSSAPGHLVRLKIPATDNKGKTATSLIYKIVIGSLTFYYQSTDMSITSWTGFCECDIPLRLGTHYNATATVMDLSGNKNKKARQFSFDIPNYKDTLEIKVDPPK